MDGVIEQLARFWCKVPLLFSSAFLVRLKSPATSQLLSTWLTILKEMLRVREVGRSVNIGDGESGIRGFTYEEEC